LRYNFLVRPSHKIVDLALAPFSEKVENHWLILRRSCGHAEITQLDSMNCLTRLCELRTIWPLHMC